ncbi:hypothetical protein D5086_021691 [Populus alba]|uniref:Uncharacterized protein n=1 Tax=Populus alba TaxID=43335 RepID=A0ACC4BEK5_POPAL
MANLPQSLSINTPFGGPSASNPAAAAGAPANKDRKMASAEHLVLDLSNPDLRENALLELSKNKDLFQDLAPFVWNSFGTIAALIQIVSIYPVLSPPNLSPAQSNRVCNALALLQCVASHPDTRMLFLNAHIPLYLYPFLNTTSKSRPFEYLRLTSLGVIGALVKVDDTEVISFLLSTEIIPLCLRTMEMGSELSKTVATFIVQKILLDDVGLDYICTTAERFFAVGRVLGNMVAALAEQPSSRLLKHIIRCYLRLSDNPRKIQQQGDGCNSCFTMSEGIGFQDFRLGEDLIICCCVSYSWYLFMYNEEKTHSSSCSCLGSLAGWHLDSEDDTLNFSAKFQSFCAASIRRSNGKVTHCLTCLAKTISDELGVTMNAVASAHLDVPSVSLVK